MANLHEELKKQLESIPENYRSEFGVCSYLSDNLDLIFRSLVERWPEFSGRSMFPVPHPALLPGDAYVYSSPEEMWNPEYPYGAARWRLIQWCIEELS